MTVAPNRKTSVPPREDPAPPSDLGGGLLRDPRFQTFLAKIRFRQFPSSRRSHMPWEKSKARAANEGPRFPLAPRASWVPVWLSGRGPPCRGRGAGPSGSKPAAGPLSPGGWWRHLVVHPCSSSHAMFRKTRSLGFSPHRRLQ
ncbi:hypothetical protein HPB47_012363 [Ixodes persulcatus]|uniref:Uncharacterized protein n=1 Tax=Ixodes persulcatus TaxID=34615 RepID=A0AC60NTR0_IXOPE|nr:hypothetical protein HPB47_012363 [Ixodes persulcatus]